MDEATAVTIFEMELNNAFQHVNNDLAEILTHAFFDCRLTNVHDGVNLKSTRTALRQPFLSRYQGRQYLSHGASYYVQHPLRGIQTLKQITDNDSPSTSHSYSTINTSIRGRRRPNFRTSNRSGVGGQPMVGDFSNRLQQMMNDRTAFMSAPPENLDRIQAKVVCISCYESFSPPDIETSNACKHSYCRDCTQNLFKNSLSNTSQFPASCCKRELPLRTFGSLLTRDILVKYEERISAQRVKKFCSHQTCSKAFRATEIKGDIGKCAVCRTLTCLKCQSSAHPDEACPENKDEKAVLAIAKEAGWRRCGSCNTMVSMQRGCNHMT
jgi:hypothetical protein